MADNPRESKKFGPAVLVVLLIIAAFLIGSLTTEIRYLKQPKSATAPGVDTSVPPPTAGPVELLREDDHVYGNRNARILLIEYSDLECPYCKRFHPTAKKIVDESEGNVAWIYRHFPLDSIHSKADQEAEAVECAGELAGNDGFWQMVDKIFEVTPSNNGLDLDTLPTLAGSIGLSPAAFSECLKSGKYTARVEGDYQSGLRVGVGGTPANFLIDTKTGNRSPQFAAIPYEQVKSKLDELLK